MAGIVEQIDNLLADLFAGWNSYSTGLVAVIVLFVVWVITESKDPDTHPLLLARQSQASYVRQPGESAVYRSPEVPYGYPLRSGLNVRAPGAPIYAAGKDGDLRDIWKRVTGELPIDKDESGQPGKILTVYGKEDIDDHNIADLSKEIAIIGKHLTSNGANRVAVYMPNSVELLLVLFAGAFYGFTVILLPYNQSHPNLAGLLNTTGADALVAAAGSFPLEDISRQAISLKQVIWSVEKTSRHVGWSEVPAGIGGKVDVSVLHELVKDGKASAELPNDSTTEPGNVVFVWQDTEGKGGEVIEFTQKNIVAAVAALGSALPPQQRFTKSDMFLPAESLTHSYPLALTLSALFTRTNVALTSVAGTGVDLGMAIRSVAPTILVASAESAAKLHKSATTSLTDAMKKLGHYMATRTLAAGRMPAGSLAAAVDNKDPAAASPGKLRLIFISERIGANTPPLTSNDLSDLRIFTKARVVYALTSAKVAGAISQTNVYDYRRGIGESENKHSHFGVPVSSVEIKMTDTATHRTSDDQVSGEITVTGPAVAGGQVSLGVNGTFRDDNTLAYA
ncbi:hypothetical protein EJ05DRAFT_443142 [Pseudovirgaria hyperparasitica]|uniref:AMP-dependent synthetase/ligase domain-containing protein n=1 Tax=Pseudovirgaria hyperparasitica TaxID=470096 RepID=A0A6A6VZQ3_9PEZI|nr:uncharacterized protein EJ05DRAFT_443142 [Pseudovirgaria hyperparasitica]KAF2754807.1 hypothetical protein EJ05DRAFT_443142 [Pseudovirgaria hyperparasitica]